MPPKVDSSDSSLAEARSRDGGGRGPAGKKCDCFLVLLVALVSPGRPPYGWCWKRGRMERENVGGKTTAEGF